MISIVIVQIQSLNVPPYLDGNNYVYCKVRMRALLESLDKQVWVSIEKGWTRPTTDIDLWSMDDLNGCNWNNKGLNAIFMVVSPE